MFGGGNTTFQFGQQQQPQQPAQGGLFGQQPAQTGFGAPAQTNSFGAATTAFGQPAQQQQSAFGAGGTAFGGFGTQNRPAFGAAPAPATGGLFGTQAQNAAPSTGFGGFGAATNTATQPSGGLFGAKPAGFGTSGGFGAATTTPAFGAPATGTAFGQPQTTGFGTGAAPAFGAAGGANQTSNTQNLGTGNPTFQPYSERDTSTTTATTNIFQTITAMTNYRNWSIEELRLQDYAMGKKAPTAGATTGFGGATTAFGQPAANTGGLFGTTNTGGFGQTQAQPTSLFGQQPAATTPTSGFGGFGQPQQTTAFGQPAQQPSGGLFGNTTTPAFGAQPAAQPATTGFGAQANTGFGGFGTPQTQQPKPAFGFGSATTTPAATTGFGGFGQPAQQPAQQTSPFGFGQQPAAQQPAQQPFSLFGNKPATATPPAGGFAFGAPATTQAAAPTGFNFGGAAAAPAQPAAGGLFGAKPATTGFSFGGATAAPATNNAFSFAQPGQTQTAAPATGFSFGAPAQQPQQGGLFGAAAPATGGLFGQAAAKPAGGLFGAPATTQAGAPSFSFGQPAATTAPSLFGAAPAAAPSGFNFGMPGQTQPQAQMGGLFGTTAPATTGTSLFGASMTQQPGLFGASTQQAQAPSLGGSIFGAPPTNVGFGTQLPPGQQALVATIDQNPYGINPFLQQTRFAGGTSASGQSISIGLGGSASPAGTSPSQEVVRKAPPLPQFKVTPRLQSKLKLKNFLTGGSTSVPPSEMGGMDSFDAVISPEKFTPRKNVKKLVLDDLQMLSSSVGIGATPGRPREARREITWGDDTGDKDRAAPAAETADAKGKRPAAPAASDFGETGGSIYPSLSDLPGSSRTRPTPPATPQAAATNGRSHEASPHPPSPRSPGFADSTDYKTTPPMSELVRRSDDELRNLSGFAVELPGFGKVSFQEPVDLLSAAPDGTAATISLIPSRVVLIRQKLVVVYPGEEGKPPVGQGLNVPARIELENCWPLDRATRHPIKDASNERMKLHIKRLETMEGTKFVSFDPLSGRWTFDVFHFTVYGLLHEGEDNEDIIVEDVDFVEDEEGYMKRAKLDGLVPRMIGFSADGSMLNESFLEDSFAYTKRAPQRRLVRRSEEEVDEDFEDLMEEPSQAEMEEDDEELDEPTQRRDEEIAGDEPSGNEPAHVEASPEKSSEQFAGAVPPSYAPSLRQAMKSSLFEKRAPTPRAQAGPSAAESSSFSSRPFFGVAPPVRVIDDERVGGGSVPRYMDVDDDVEEVSPVPSTVTPSVPQVPASVKKLRSLDTVVPVAKSLVAGKEGLFVDAGLAMGRSFRVGWGPNGTFVTRGVVENGLLSFGKVFVESIDVFAAGGGEAAKAASAETLQCHFDHAVVTRNGEEAPSARVVVGSKFADYATLAGGKAHFTETEQQVWTLGRALLDPLDIPSEREISVEGTELSDRQKQYVREMYRKASVSRWLRDAVSKVVTEEIQRSGRSADPADVAFAHLSGCNTAKACVLAASVGDVRLATILSQLGASGTGPGAVRSRLPGVRGAKAACFGHGVPGSNFAPQAMLSQVKNQVQVWMEKAQDRFINPKRLRLWQLAAGNVDNALVGGSLSDWKRVLGLFLWYEDGGANNLAQVLDSYDAGWTSRQIKIAKPLPLYLERSDPKPDDSPRYDILYHFLKLFVSERHLLETALHPLNASKNILDYRLPWLLYTMVSRSYKFREFRDTKVDSVVIDARDEMVVDGDAIQRNAGFDILGGPTTDNLSLSVAFQLEKMGLWQWAVYVCLYLSSEAAREQTIRELLCRNFPLEDKSDSMVDKLFPKEGTQAFARPNSALWDFLTRKLQIPGNWIHEAKALRARYEGELGQELASLLDAKLYQEAHRIIARTLAPQMIVNSNYTLLRRLLLEVKGRPGVDGWSYGGELLLLYMDAISGVSTPSKPAPATVPLAQRLGGPSTADGALRPFQATSFGVPSLAPKGDRAKELQTLLDRISDVERLQIKTGRMGISEEERKQEDLDMRACLAYMRKRVERLATETRKMAQRMDSDRTQLLVPPISSDAWFAGVGGLV